MKREQDAADAAVAPALLVWSRLIQAAAAAVIILSLTLLLAPRLGEAIFNLVYFHQPSIPVEVPNLAMGYIWFANGIIGAVMAGWMICIILSARGPFVEGRVHGWKTIAMPLASWFLIDTVFSIANGVWGNVLLGIALHFSRRHFSPEHWCLGLAGGNKSPRWSGSLVGFLGCLHLLLFVSPSGVVSV